MNILFIRFCQKLEKFSESWWSNSIDEKMIKLSFKKAGINLNLNGSEDVLFNWPKQPEMLKILKKLNKIILLII